MPALAFGLNSAKNSPTARHKRPQKRKAVFDDEADEIAGDANGNVDGQDGDGHMNDIRGHSKKVSKGPPLLQDTGEKKYGNLSALRSAKLQDKQASEVDSSVYDYDEVYETFHAPKEAKKESDTTSGPKYMGALVKSAEVRKRDQERAKEKLLLKERETEGDEFADKEKFVTSAYKKQQEERRILEAEEAKREAEEEEKRRKGGGMTAFHKNVLQKEEERSTQIAKATEEASRRKESGFGSTQDAEDEEKSAAQVAKELNDKGAHITIDEEGEVVDKRQLLSAGLNVAPKKPDAITQASMANNPNRPQDHWKSAKAHDARQAQRERQTRMMEKQIEEMTKQQEQVELEGEKQQAENLKSKVTEDKAMSARERYLQRKKEEELARKAKSNG